MSEQKTKKKRSRERDYYFPKAPSTKREWTRFSKRLALVLADLDEDEVLIVSAKERLRYVQFAAQENFGMRIEAMSSQFIGEEKFSKKQRRKLHKLGYRKPTYVHEGNDQAYPDGSCNSILTATKNYSTYTHMWLSERCVKCMTCGALKTCSIGLLE